jgi:hypothetical protein
MIQKAPARLPGTPLARAHISRARLPRALVTAALAAGLVFGLSACGKKGGPRPPAGEEEQYTYPNAYPAPNTVTPGGGGAAAQGDDPFWLFSPGDEKRTKTKSY